MRDRGRPTLRSALHGSWSSCRRCGARYAPPTKSRRTASKSALDWSAWTAWSPPGEPSCLPSSLDAAARRGPVLDLRSGSYQAVGRPTGLDDRTVTLRIRPSPGGAPHIGDVIAKRVRGKAASHVLSSVADPADPLDIADLLATRWSLEIDSPAGRNRTWTITLQSEA